MINRRQFLVGSGAAALVAGGVAPPAWGQEKKAWAPYSGTLAIDACGGFGRFPGNPDGSLNALELADARESGLSAVVLTLAPTGRFRFRDSALETTMKEFAHWEAQIAAHPDSFTAVRTGADLERAQRERKVGLVYGFQESSPIGEDPDRIGIFKRLGLRVLQLTHNRRNLVGDGCMEPGNAGLSELGLQVIERLNAEKVLVDLAHGGQRTVREAIAASKAPVVISHSGCRALSNLPRLTADAELKAMANRGGVVGILFWPYLREQGQPMVADLIRHIEHAIKVCGEDHVGIGSDNTLSPVDRTPEFEKGNLEFMKGLVADGVLTKGRSPELVTFIPELNHARRFETLGALLSARGHSDARIAKILGGNFARVMREVWG
ncbi:dipeptidase [Hyalangium rubrum]|uniref:Membrane dipeptidase n=1 Tax=Hyalangium rubrum TaxID=3103134 RepID=A0ABU5HGJ5_9BACT|nr:membrane dipeptidase [Hyalangium sp. s54d21]MDY7232579.1 membrane dipeptidase [Hyalangium sp. s54d21]